MHLNKELTCDKRIPLKVWWKKPSPLVQFIFRGLHWLRIISNILRYAEDSLRCRKGWNTSRIEKLGYLARKRKEKNNKKGTFLTSGHLSFTTCASFCYNPIISSPVNRGIAHLGAEWSMDCRICSSIFKHAKHILTGAVRSIYSLVALVWFVLDSIDVKVGEIWPPDSDIFFQQFRLEDHTPIRISYSISSVVSINLLQTQISRRCIPVISKQIISLTEEISETLTSNFVRFSF